MGSERAFRIGRTQRLRLLLVLAAAVVATIVPLTLAATDALRPLGIDGNGASLRNVALILALGFLAPVASLRLSTLRVLGVGVVAATLLALVAEPVDATAMLSLAYPAIGLATSLLGTLAANHVMIEFEHEHQRLMCERFVPEQVVEQVLARIDDHIGLGGVETAGTIVFVDLRNFTSYCEERPARQVIRVLNRYLTEISCGILAHGGTVVSYLGDGLMAVFGAPLEQQDHADRALSAAREILGVRLPRANMWMRDEGLGEGFQIGIGVNSGCFIAGNVGSERRLEYTAIGDAANTASRIEGLTKSSGRMLLVSDATRASLSTPADDLVRVGEFDVRGRAGKVGLWSLEGPPSLGGSYLVTA